jgi:hypothetical protein
VEELLTKTCLSLRKGDKVEQAVNNFEKGILQGDIGLVTRTNEKDISVVFGKHLVLYHKEETYQLKKLIHAERFDQMVLFLKEALETLPKPSESSLVQSEYIKWYLSYKKKINKLIEDSI